MSTTSGGAGSGSGVMMSNLPLVFCKSLPSSIDSLNAKELQNFLVFLMRCVHNVNPIQWSRMNRPTWWSSEIPLSPIVLSKRFRTPEWQAKIRAMIISCYIHYDAVFLLQFSGQLAESVKEGFRMGDNSDGTTSLYDRSSGKLLVTFRNENKDYDAAPAKSEEKEKAASSKRPQLMPVTPKEKEPPKEAVDSSDKMVERPTTDIYLCDHCGAEFPTLSAIRVHEDQCIIGKEAKGEKVIQNDIQELKDIDQGKYLWYLGLVSATEKVRPPNVTPAKQYPAPKRAPSMHIRKTAGVPFSSILGRQIFSNGQVNGKESLRRYEDHCHTSDPYQATPTTYHPTFSVTYKRPGPKSLVPWVHSYSFNAQQRREQLKRIDTGLTKDSRQLLRECKKLRVALKRLDPKEIEEWTRPKPKPLPTPSLNRLPVLSMPFNNRPRFPLSGTSAPPLIAPVPSHRLRGPPPLVPINPAVFRQMYRAPGGIANSAPYTIQNGIIRFNNPTPANLAYRTPPPLPRPPRPVPVPVARPEPNQAPVVVDLCSSDEEEKPAPPKSTTSHKDKPAPKKATEISVVPLKNLLEPQVILQEPQNYLRFRNMPMVPTRPKQNPLPSHPPALAPKPRPLLAPIAPRPQLVPSRMPLRPPIQLKPNFIPGTSSILGGVGVANSPLSFHGTAPRTVVARAPTVNLATGAHPVPVSAAQLAKLGRQIVITSSTSKDSPPPKVAPLNLGHMPADKKAAMNEALRKLHQHAFPSKQPIQIKFSNKPTAIGKDFAPGGSTVAKKVATVSPAASKPTPVAQIQIIVQNPESDQADKAKVPTTPLDGEQPSSSNVTPTDNAKETTAAKLDDKKIASVEAVNSAKPEEAETALKADDSRKSSESPGQEEEPKLPEMKLKELENTPQNEVFGEKDEKSPGQGGKEGKKGGELKVASVSSLAKRGRGKDVQGEEEHRVVAGKSCEPIVELPETIAGISAQALRAKRDTAQLFRDECKELRQHGLVDILSSTERVTRRRTLAAVTPETAAPPKKKRKSSAPSESSESPRPASKAGMAGEPEMGALVVDGDADRDENSNKEAKIDWLKEGETSRGSWTPVSSKEDQSRVSTPSSSISPGPDSEARRRMKRELQLLQGDECKELAVKGLHTLAQTTGRVLRRSIKQLPSS